MKQIKATSEDLQNSDLFLTNVLKSVDSNDDIVLVEVDEPRLRFFIEIDNSSKPSMLNFLFSIKEQFLSKNKISFC